MKLSDILGSNCDPIIIKETARGFLFINAQNIDTELIDEKLYVSAGINCLKSRIEPREYTDEMVKSLRILLHNMWVGRVLNKLK